MEEEKGGLKNDETRMRNEESMSLSQNFQREWPRMTANAEESGTLKFAAIRAHSR
jgi:hypothetical protein